MGPKTNTTTNGSTQWAPWILQWMLFLKPSGSSRPHRPWHANQGIANTRQLIAAKRCSWFFNQQMPYGHFQSPKGHFGHSQLACFFHLCIPTCKGPIGHLDVSACSKALPWTMHCLFFGMHWSNQYITINFVLVQYMFVFFESISCTFGCMLVVLTIGSLWSLCHRCYGCSFTGMMPKSCTTILFNSI